MIENPVPWPNGAKCAVAITFDMDSDSILHLDHPQRASTMMSTASWLRYDRIAVPRIIKMYEKYDIRQTFFVPGWCAEQYPDAVKAMIDGGHEVAHHGYLHENPNSLSQRDEEYWFMRGIDALERISGSRPRGFRAPLYNFSKHTADLLVREGFRYDTSLMGDDVPYVLETGKGELIELPTDWSMDDWPQYTHNPDLHYQMPINSPDRAMDVYWAQFEAAWEFGGLWVSVWHPFVSGRLSRLMRVDKMIQQMLDKGDVWFATLEEIAAHVTSVSEKGEFVPRRERVPFYDAPVAEFQ
jgi:peptidoglycan/xylan/chitin deacetylase (PgdA/CDA1 family)